MASDLIEVGEVTRPHGVHGEVRVAAFTNTPEFFTRFTRLVAGTQELRVLSARVHKGCVIVKLDGVASVEAANALRGTVLLARRSDASLDDGERFVADLIGLRAVDDATGDDVGVITDFFSLPSNGVYVVRKTSDSREMLIPAVPEFVRSIDSDCVRFRLIEGL